MFFLVFLDLFEKIFTKRIITKKKLLNEKNLLNEEKISIIINLEKVS